MSLSIVQSRTQAGVGAPLVTIEVHLSKGLPSLNIVGLPETAVKESKDRVRSALINNGFEFPIKRIIVNLAPADLPKQGGRFDLPIALGILAASNQIPQNELNQYEFVGELALTGELRPVRGILPFAIATQNSGRHLILPRLNAQEASLVKNLSIFPGNSLLDVCNHLKRISIFPAFIREETNKIEIHYPDMADVIGQAHGKRAIEIAAAGGHSLLLKGPPGSGKTMLASRLPGILPKLSENEALEVAAIYSISRSGFCQNAWSIRPFRAPHHTCSAIALVGGGRPPSPGEISLSHKGVLFLDELPEFPRHALEALREPLEANRVTISRASFYTQFPAEFQLIAAMNPCPCGYAGDSTGRCQCTYEQIQHYQQKLSGPLLDRIDMHIEIPRLPSNRLLSDEKSESSEQIRLRVMQARENQNNRQKKINSLLNIYEIKNFCALEKRDQNFLNEAIEKLGLSARAYHRILRLTRTMADLSNSQNIRRVHLDEALSYRCSV